MSAEFDEWIIKSQKFKTKWKRNFLLINVSNLIEKMCQVKLLLQYSHDSIAKYSRVSRLTITLANQNLSKNHTTNWNIS